MSVTTLCPENTEIKRQTIHGPFTCCTVIPSEDVCTYFILYNLRASILECTWYNKWGVIWLFYSILQPLAVLVTLQSQNKTWCDHAYHETNKWDAKMFLLYHCVSKWIYFCNRILTKMIKTIALLVASIDLHHYRDDWRTLSSKPSLEDQVSGDHPFDQ